MKYLSEDFIKLEDLYLAYKKAKIDAFFESTHFNAVAFAKYEDDLSVNLRELLRKLKTRSALWTIDNDFLGGFLYAPKSVDCSRWEENAGIHYRTVNPLDEWRYQFDKSGNARADAQFRLVIAPSVDFQIISALWILKVGHLLEGMLDSRVSYGNRLRRVNGIFNKECHALFAQYTFAYRKWRELGLKEMAKALSNGDSIVAVTMDLRRFYHNVSPRFLLRKSYLETVGVSLDRDQILFTRLLLSAIDTWYKSTPDYRDRPAGCLPVGLSASKIISNVLLIEFDRRVVEGLQPIYYGRYVDDVFLVLRRDGRVLSGEDLMRRIESSLGGIAEFVDEGGAGGAALRIKLQYAKDSDLVFAGKKQKIFNLDSVYGLDLISHISEQIRVQSSEHRLLSELPSTNTQMAARALLATPDAKLEADALRKADSVSIRRLGFSLLLRDVECYARELRPSDWQQLRKEFYGLVYRYLLSPEGVFDYWGYLHRVFGLIVACGDYRDAGEFIKKLGSVLSLIAETTSAGTSEKEKFRWCRTYFKQGLMQVALQASTVRKFDVNRAFLNLLKSVAKLDGSGQPTLAVIRETRKRLLFSDLGRRPYKEYWYFEQNFDIKRRVPRSKAVLRLLRLGSIRKFRKISERNVPDWRALVFATRPLSVAEIGMVAPNIFADPALYRRTIMALRGARVWGEGEIGYALSADNRTTQFVIPNSKADNPVRIAVTSIETTPEQWVGAVKKKPDRSLERYQKYRTLINNVLREEKRADYIVFPECSIPRRWAIGIAGRLARSSVSFLAGLEYYRRGGLLRNDCLLSLVTTWPGYPTNIIALQPKLSPAHEEKLQLWKMAKIRLFEPPGEESSLPVYVHGQHRFGLLLCSDLTNIRTRNHFQGKVDSLFVLEWNQDIGTFGFLIESAAHDVHAFIVQVNNRMYGDSRVRAPFKADYLRDAVRLKGGISDYYVMAEIDYFALRRFQAKKSARNDEFKPIPIGFVISEERRAINPRR